MQSRREFLIKGCTGCASIIMAGLFTSSISSCGTALTVYKAQPEQNFLKVPVTAFTNESKMIIVRNAQLEFDILLIKISETDYRALYMKCTHRDNPLTTNDKGIYCAAHGSTFDLNGNVTKEPALHPLKKFNTEIIESNILINLKS